MKKIDFKWRLKLSTEKLSSSGIEFHSLGGATANVLSPQKHEVTKQTIDLCNTVGGILV